jgi:hypothetical protein
LEEFPAPLGSSLELFKPPTLAGPDGTPLNPDVPAPAEPAFGEPAAVLLPVEGPLAAPPALAPPAPPPLLAPPPLWASDMTGKARITAAVTTILVNIIVIGDLLFCGNGSAASWFLSGTIRAAGDWLDGIFAARKEPSRFAQADRL